MKQFFKDVRGVLSQPKKQLAEIHARRAGWGSFCLVFVYYYATFGIWDGLYFGREPFPLYDILFPALPATLFTLLFFLAVHWAVRLGSAVLHLIGRLRGTEVSLAPTKRGRYSDAFRVYGFTNLPRLLMSALAMGAFLSVPQSFVDLWLQHRVLAITLIVVFSAVQIVWSLIVKVLALRLIYGLRDLRAIVNFFVAGAIFTAFFLPVMILVGQMRVPPAELWPYLKGRFQLQIPSEFSEGVGLPTDRLAFRLRAPERYELVSAAGSQQPGSNDYGLDVNFGGMSSAKQIDQRLVRVLGVPGDTVAFEKGKLRLNSRTVEEPYLVVARPSSLTMPELLLNSNEYLLVPDYGEDQQRWLKALPRQVIDARLAWDRRFPFGWIYLRPEVFRKPAQ